MHIALNAAAFAPGSMGGVETYLRNLVQSLQDFDGDNDYLFICNERHTGFFPLSNPRFTAFPARYAKPSPLWYLRVAVKDATGFDLLRPLMNRLRVDMVHHPFSVLNPADLRVPSVLTFIDLQHEFFPENFSPRELRSRQTRYRHSAQQATRIITISRHAKTTLVACYGIDPDKIEVIPIGYAPQFRVIDDPARLEAVRKRHRLERPFVYYPAATWPHKNHQRLLKALAIMKKSYGFDGQLVLTGSPKQAGREILLEIERQGLQDDVKILGYLPEEELPILYNLARLMVFPSLFEGFGIPLVEAMACACPVACSAITAIPEVVGDAALMFDPFSPEDIARQAWQLWSDAPLRQRSILRGLERAQMFTWEDMARQTIKVYQKVAQGGSA